MSKITNSIAPPQKTRHVLGLSGGKDSAALAVYLRERGDVPDMEYYFSDTGKELPEVYSFLDKLEAYLGVEIKRLSAARDFDHYMKVKGHLLPSPQRRWCTRMLKIKPFEDFVGNDCAVSYIGIRADENRKGYISTKKNITACYPFIDDGLAREDIFRIFADCSILLRLPEISLRRLMTARKAPTQGSSLIIFRHANRLAAIAISTL